MKKPVRKNSNNSVETITISTQTIEYDYSYEENDLVHLEMNLIEMPFFNKNSKIKKNTSIIYNFNRDKSSYLQVKPGYNLPIPGEKEEKIFYALLKILQKNNFLQSEHCYTDYYEIIKEMGLIYSGRERQSVKKGLEILRETHYEFQNSFYTKMDGEHQKVSFNELKKLLNITFITFDKTSSEFEKNLFTNNKKEIIRIELSNFIKNNILNKIFIYFSKQDLMSLENAVTRNLWIKLTKWRNGKLFLKVSAKNIATKIPLSWTPSTYSKTIIIIKKALEDLREKNLLMGYEFINSVDGKKITNEKSYFEIKFDEVHNEKRNNFSLGKGENSYHDEYDTSIEHIEYMPEKEKIGENEDIGKISDTLSDNSVDELFNLLDEKGKKLSTMRRKIEKFLEKNSFEEIKMAILYTNKNAKKSYGKYFTDTLENRWYEEFQQNILQEEEKVKEKQKQIQEVQQQELELEVEKEFKQQLKDKTKELFHRLSPEKQEELENLAREDYISQGETPGIRKTLQSFFNKMKWGLTCEYLIKIEYFQEVKEDKKEIEPAIIVEEKKKISKKVEMKTLDKKEIRRVLNENIEALLMIYDLDEDEILELKLLVAKAALAQEFVTEEFIQKNINEIIKSWQ